MNNKKADMVLIPRNMLESIFKAMHTAEYCHWGCVEINSCDYDDYGEEGLIHKRCFTSSSPEWKAVKKALKSK